MKLCAEAQIATWLFGGWAEELWHLSPPRLHRDIDLLYPARNFQQLDGWLLMASDELIPIVAKRFSHNRAQFSPLSERSDSDCQASCLCSSTAPITLGSRPPITPIPNHKPPRAFPRIAHPSATLCMNLESNYAELASCAAGPLHQGSNPSCRRSSSRSAARAATGSMASRTRFR
jgi:hypothetical protein